MRIRSILLALSGVFALAIGHGWIAAAGEPVRFTAFGDMPYNWPRDLARFADLIAEINRLRPDFAVHVGDIKSGGAPCTDEAYRTVFQLLERSEPPLLYTPGDNEWTDCRRKSAGSYDPEERLSLLRRIFFPSARSLGSRPIALETQFGEPGFSEFVEHRRWRIGEVVFATLHVVGSNNNWGHDAAGDAEHKKRMKAVFAWMDSTFAEAVRNGAGAVVLFFQADPLFQAPFPFRTGFNTFIAALEREVGAFGKPVLIVHGDSHKLALDRPLRTPDNDIVRNLVRLVVPGANRIEAVLVTVDPAADPPFAFARVPGGKVLTAPWGGS